MRVYVAETEWGEALLAAPGPEEAERRARGRHGEEALRSVRRASHEDLLRHRQAGLRVPAGAVDQARRKRCP